MILHSMTHGMNHRPPSPSLKVIALSEGEAVLELQRLRAQLAAEGAARLRLMGQCEEMQRRCGGGGGGVWGRGLQGSMWVGCGV